jgi:hypothetical protein
VSTKIAIAVAAGLGAIGAGIAGLDDPHGPWVPLALLGAGVVIGELLELRPAGRPPIPLSYAVVLVLVRAASATQFAIVMLGAELVAFVLRREPTAWRRPVVTAERLAGAAAAFALYRWITEAIPGPEGRWVVLLALTAAAVGEIALGEITAMALEHRFELTITGRSAELALVTSGMLMSIGYSGIEGVDAMGLWGPLLFSVPLLAAWYSFERLASIRRTYLETMRALSVVPELGGLVREGHAERVTDLAVAVGRELDFDRRELEYLEAASLLHHLGHVCLDDPEVLGRPVQPWEVSAASAAMLRETEYLAPAGDLLLPDPLPFGGAARSAQSIGGQVLKVASAFDELTEGDHSRAEAALGALSSGPGYIYDPRVLWALERVLDRRGLLLVRA